MSKYNSNVMKKQPKDVYINEMHVEDASEENEDLLLDENSGQQKLLLAYWTYNKKMDDFVCQES